MCEISENYTRFIRNKYKKSVTSSKLTRDFLPDSGKAWRWGKYNGSFYYCLKNIPDRKPNYYRSRFGDEQSILEQYYKYCSENKAISLKEELSEFIKKRYVQYIPAYQELPIEKQVALAKSCATVEFGVLKLKNKSANPRKSTFFSRLANIIRELRLNYLPASVSRLKEKILNVYRGIITITEAIYIKNIGNSNAALFADKQVESWVMQLRSMDSNYSDAYIVRKIKAMCKMTGKRVPSDRWIGNIMERHSTKYITAEQRFGKGNRRAVMHQSYVPVANALYAGDCWQVDATRVNMISHKKADGKQGFLFIIAVRDVHSGDIIGYGFDYKEDRWSVLNAVKMAAQNTGYLPYEIVFDRFPGHNTPEAKLMTTHMQRLGVKITTTHKATGKAKLERAFGTIQSVFMMDSPYYYGEGVKSTRMAAHRSAEYLARIQKQAHRKGWDLTASVNEAERVVENYRNTALSYYSRKYKDVNKSPAELHADSEKPNVIAITDATISLLFGFKKQKKITRNGIITTEIQKTELHYAIDDFDVIKENENVIMSYDVADLSRVFLFKKKHDFLIYLCEAKSIEPVQIYGPTAEWSRLAKEKMRQKELNELRKKELEKQQKLSEQADEVPLLMAQLTNKKTAEEEETAQLLRESHEYKKAAGGYDDIDNEIDTDQLVIGMI